MDHPPRYRQASSSRRSHAKADPVAPPGSAKFLLGEYPPILPRFVLRPSPSSTGSFTLARNLTFLKKSVAQFAIYKEEASDLVIIADEAKALGGGRNGYREAVQRYLLRALAAKGFFEEIENPS